MSWQPRGATGTADAGLSLVEVMVAMVLFMLGSLSLLSVLVSSMSGTFDNRARLTATNLAAADIDAARDEDYFALATLPARTETVDGRTYQVTRQVTPVLASPPPGDKGPCDGSGSARQLYKRVSTSVETSFKGATTRPVRSDTVVRAPIYNPSSASGAIGFRVENRDGKPLNNLQVTASTLTRTTDTTGCAFFDGLTPGPVTVTVNSPGSITREGSTALAKPMQVTKGQITTDGLRIHGAVTLNVRAQAFSGTTASSGFEAPGGANVTIAASDRSNVTRVTYPSKPLPPGGTASWTAFPSRGGYDAWLGECSPVVHGESEPAPAPAPATLVLPLSPVTVHLTTGNGGDNPKARGRSVTVTLQPSSCAETYTYTSTTSTGCDATSEGNKCSVQVAVPPGTWTFTVPPNATQTQSYSVSATVLPRTARTVSIPVT